MCWVYGASGPWHGEVRASLQPWTVRMGAPCTPSMGLLSLTRSTARRPSDGMLLLLSQRSFDEIQHQVLLITTSQQHCARLGKKCVSSSSTEQQTAELSNRHLGAFLQLCYQFLKVVRSFCNL